MKLDATLTLPELDEICGEIRHLPSTASVFHTRAFVAMFIIWSRLGSVSPGGVLSTLPLHIWALIGTANEFATS